MLIRSQDKKRIANVDTCNLITIVGSCGETQNVTVDGMVIGTYSTEEKAIKVLDMIQEKYGTYMCVENAFEGVQGYYNMPKVFQMPQDSEV